jgi:hypothetical protein
MPPMRILLVAPHLGDAHAVESALVEEGHTVVTCTDDVGEPCRGVSHHDECPLESSVDLAVLTPSDPAARTLAEMGAICAARHRVGVVELDVSKPSNRSLYELADDAEREICDGYVATVTDLIRAVHPVEPFDVAISRSDQDVRVRVTLHFNADPITVTGIADRARAAVRRHDRFARVIDVSVVQPARLN